jgi:AbrB family looped-hinge helix DNA binding protein
MIMSRMTSKGQTTIPKEIRERLGLKPGDRVAFILRGNEAVLYPVKGSLLDLRGSLKPRQRPEDVDFIDAYNASWMKAQGVRRVYAFDKRHYERMEGLEVSVP